MDIYTCICYKTFFILEIQRECLSSLYFINIISVSYILLNCLFWEVGRNVWILSRGETIKLIVIKKNGLSKIPSF